MQGRKQQKSSTSIFLLFCFFAAAAATDGQARPSFVDIEAQPDRAVPLLTPPLLTPVGPPLYNPEPSAPVLQAVQEEASSQWANYRKPWSAFSAQTVQPQPAQAPMHFQQGQEPIRCIVVDDPEAPTVFGASGGPIVGSAAHVELTTKQVKMEVKKLVKLAKDQLTKLSFSEARLMAQRPSMSDFLRQVRQTAAVGGCWVLLYLGECVHFLLLGNPILCTLCLPFHCILLCCTALLQTCFCQKEEEQWEEADEYEEE